INGHPCQHGLPTQDRAKFARARAEDRFSRGIGADRELMTGAGEVLEEQRCVERAVAQEAQLRPRSMLRVTRRDSGDRVAPCDACARSPRLVPRVPGDKVWSAPPDWAGRTYRRTFLGKRKGVENLEPFPVLIAGPQAAKFFRTVAVGQRQARPVQDDKDAILATTQLGGRTEQRLRDRGGGNRLMLAGVVRGLSLPPLAKNFGDPTRRRSPCPPGHPYHPSGTSL